MTTAAPKSSQTTSIGVEDDITIPKDRLKPVQINLNLLLPSPPPRPFLQDSDQCLDDRTSSDSCHQVHPSHSDAVLVATLDGGRNPFIPTIVGTRILNSDMEPEAPKPATVTMKTQAPRPPDTPTLDLQSMARASLAAARLSPKFATSVEKATQSTSTANPVTREQLASGPEPPSLQGLDIRSPTANGHGELPPLQASPSSDYKLPSIRSTLGDISQNFPIGRTLQTSIGLPPLPSHASPPVSPNEWKRGVEFLPGRSAQLPYIPYSSGSGTRPSVDYSSSSTETPESNSSSTPSVAERMSIDNMTNHFVCTFAGCTAPPFQTQYLLNSHANVHSFIRPHYCSVPGCPRAEGGKGFKRKNEMIRHGLVHDSPGYICPFCPEREHKYPRPDNLQRWVFRDLQELFSILTLRISHMETGTCEYTILKRTRMTRLSGRFLPSDLMDPTVDAGEEQARRDKAKTRLRNMV